MSEPESERRIILAGRYWDLQPLPFQLLKKVQPRLIARFRDFGDDAMSTALRLDEEALEDLADCAFLAIGCVDKTLTREAFFELPFSVLELLGAAEPLLSACGMRRRRADEAGEGVESDAEKK